MTTPRRRLIRSPAPPVIDQQRQLRHDKLRARLERERVALGRWMQRLKRSFHAVEKIQQRISRLERQSARTEE